MVCANARTSTEAYCSYDVGPGVHILKSALDIWTLHSKYTRALTFENLCQACARCKSERRSGVQGTYSAGDRELAGEDSGGGAQGELITFHERMLNKVMGDKFGVLLLSIISCIHM